MKNSFIKRASIILLAMTMLPATLFAHSGRTDSRGGHKDNKNKSGLGSYHYHCGGYPAHLHTNGCPYSGSNSYSSISNSSSSKPSSSSSKPKPAKPTYKTTVAKFNIGGTYLEINGIIDNEMTLVEMRSLCDALGIQIAWDNGTSTATCTKDSTSFSLTVGSKSARLNGNPVALERAPKLMNGKILLPARFVAESIGGNVIYNAATGVIEINNTNNSNKKTLSSSEMKKIGVNFVMIDNQNVASLWNSAVYYTVGSDIIETKYMLGDKTTVQLSDKVRLVDGLTIFPKDIMDYLYIEDYNIETALDVHGITDYEVVKDYWKKK